MCVNYICFSLYVNNGNRITGVFYYTAIISHPLGYYSEWEVTWLWYYSESFDHPLGYYSEWTVTWLRYHSESLDQPLQDSLECYSGRDSSVKIIWYTEDRTYWCGDTEDRTYWCGIRDLPVYLYLCLINLYILFTMGFIAQSF